MQPFIQSLKINNLLSFGPDSPAIELGPLNVIIGANGSGKSNLFDVLALLKNAPGRFDQPIIDSGCPLSEWFWKSSKNETQLANIVAVITLEQYPVTHTIPFCDDERVMIINEEIKSPFANIVSQKKTISRDGLTTQVIERRLEKSLLSFPEPVFSNEQDQNIYDVANDALRILKSQSALISFYQSIHIYNDWTFGRKSPLRFAQLGYLPDKWLNEDGSNLGVVLRKIKANQKSHVRYLGFLKQLYEGVDDYEIDEYKDGTLRVYLREGERIIHAARLSNGTLRYLMLMAVLCDPEPPPVVCIEEPEMGLHPDLILPIAEALEFAAERTQVIVTTHSDRLVDYFTHSPEVIQVCEKHEGQTYIERLNPEELKPWLEKYSLGEYWSRGGIGGNRW